MKSTNPVVQNAIESVARNMSAQQALTLVELEIGKDDDEAENLLDQYGSLIRRGLGERVYKDLADRVYNSKAGC